MKSLLGIDTGGTFTDFILLQGKQLRTHKVLSTPKAPEQAILQGITELGLDLSDTAIIHGSTVATNALLEYKGVKTAYVTNRGLADVLTIGRQARRELYNLQPQAVRQPVPCELCFETGGRIAADGSITEDLTSAELDELYSKIARAKPDAIAINLLFSFLDDRFEKQIEEKLQHLAFVCRSSQVLPEYKEYERGIATWLNAYVGPLMQGYLQRLQQGVTPAKLSIMQSSGGTINADNAARFSVNLLLSGPAGGLRAAKFIGELCKLQSLLTFDMGGTSTDVALIDGDIQLTNEGEINGLPVAVPMVDMHTIGAGGGSIAWLDDGGMLQVGPQSAGASPGPACYKQGGTQATVTDANLLLGHIPAHSKLGGNMPLDREAARQALQTIADQLNTSAEQIAQGIIRIANEHMAQALRVISVQRGLDPRHYVLSSFGGAGGLHVCDLAEILGMEKALVPIHGGVLSALGMLASPHSREFSQTIGNNEHPDLEQECEQLFQKLEQQGQQALLDEGIAARLITLDRSVDLRYTGQSYTIRIRWQGMDESRRQFHETHLQRFGHKLDEPVELVNLRIRAVGPQPPVELPRIDRQSCDEQIQQGRVYGIDDTVPIFQREQLDAHQTFVGPALICEKVSTTLLRPLWQCRVDEIGNLHLEKLGNCPKN